MSKDHNTSELSTKDGCTIENNVESCVVYNKYRNIIYTSTSGKLFIRRGCIYNYFFTHVLFNINSLILNENEKYINGKSVQIFSNTEIFKSIYSSLKFPSVDKMIYDIIEDDENFLINVNGKWYDKKGMLIKTDIT